MRKFNLIAAGFCFAFFVVAVCDHGFTFVIFMDLTCAGYNLYLGLE